MVAIHAREMPLFASLAEAPTPAAYGIGPAWIGGIIYWSDGTAWISGSTLFGTISVDVAGAIAAGDTATLAAANTAILAMATAILTAANSAIAAGDAAILAATLKTSITQIPDASLAYGIHAFNFANGNVQKLTATGDIAIIFSNVPADVYATFTIFADNWGAYNIALPSHKKAGGTALTFTAGGIDRIIAEFDHSGELSLVMCGKDNK